MRSFHDFAERCAACGIRRVSPVTSIAVIGATLVLIGCGGGGGSGVGNQLIARLNQQIKSAPDNPEGYVDRGLAWLEMEKYDPAAEDFKKALDLQGNNAYYHTLLARSCLGQKLYDVALARLVQARVFDVNLQDIYWVRGQIFQAKGDEQTALANFDTAVGIDRKKIEPYLKRGDFYLQGQRYADAAKDFSKAVSLDSSNAAAYDGMGRVYFAQQRYDSAFIAYDRANALDKTNPHFLSHEAQAYYERRDKNSATRMYTEALKYSDRLPNNEIMRINGLLKQMAES